MQTRCKAARQLHSNLRGAQSVWIDKIQNSFCENSYFIGDFFVLLLLKYVEYFRTLLATRTSKCARTAAMSDEEGQPACCAALDKKKEGTAKKANHYGVKSIVPPHDPKLNVMVVDVEDLAKVVEDKGVCTLCRCYKSKKFPFCDGSHNSHNEETGDNAGPIVILPEGWCSLDTDVVCGNTSPDKTCALSVP